MKPALRTFGAARQEIWAAFGIRARKLWRMALRWHLVHFGDLRWWQRLALKEGTLHRYKLYAYNGVYL